MSENFNPYQSPEADTKVTLVSSGALTETMLKYLGGASPWLRFVGILGFIAAGFLFLIGLFFIAFRSLAVSFFDEASASLSGFFYSSGSAAVILTVYALYFMGAGALAFFPALFTYRFGAGIRKYFLTGSGEDLERSFKNNKSLWKFQGILLIITLAVVLLVMVITIIVAVAAMAI